MIESFARYPFGYPFIDKHCLDTIRLTVLEGDPAFDGALLGAFEGDRLGLVVGCEMNDEKKKESS